MKNKLNFGCKLVSLLILLSFIIDGWEVTYISFQIALYQWWETSFWWAIYLIITTSLFLFLNASAAYGVFYTKKWGFILVYLAIIFSTFFFSYSYVPFIVKIINNMFSIHPRYITFIVINLIVICYVAYLHVLYRRVNR